MTQKGVDLRLIRSARSSSIPANDRMKTKHSTKQKGARQLPLQLDIDLKEFKPVQQQALFELLILAMYADGHLTTMKDEQLQKLLTAMGHTEESDRQREFDAAVTRIRPFIASLQKAKDHALMLAGAFTDRRQQKQVYAAVQQIMTFDQNVSTWETTLLSELRLKFRV